MAVTKNKLHFRIKRYNSNITIQLEDAQGVVQVRDAKERTKRPAKALKKALTAFYAALERREGELFASSRMLIEGCEHFADFQLLRALRTLFQERPKTFVNARFVTKPLPAEIVVDPQQTNILHLQATVKRMPILLDGKQATLFGHDVLWACAFEEDDLLLFELDTRHQNVLDTLSEHCQETIPHNFADIFIERNYYNAGKLGRVAIGNTQSIQDISVQPEARLYLKKHENAFKVDVAFGYRSHETRPYTAHDIYFYDNAIISRIKRDLDREEKYLLQLAEHVERVGNHLLPKGDTLDWLTTIANTLIRQGFVIYGKESLFDQAVSGAEGRISVQAHASDDWLDLDVTCTFGEENIEIKELVRSLMNRERFIQLSDGSKGVIPQKWITKLSSLVGLLQEEDGKLRGTHAQTRVVEQLLETAEESKATLSFKALQKQIQKSLPSEEAPLPETLQATLRPYQQAGYNWMHFLRQHGFGGILADEMGLGKTLQTLTLLLYQVEQDPTVKHLVILPSSLVFNWQQEMEKFTPEMTHYVHHGSGRKKTLEKLKKERSHVWLTTYNTMRNDIELLEKLRFDYIVLDEAHYIKNPTSQVAKSVCKLKSNYRLTVTGTPIENTVAELWSQFAFLNPGLLGSHKYFLDSFGRAAEVGDEHAQDKIRVITNPFLLQRKKESVAKDLPPKQISVEYCEMTNEQRALYETTKQTYHEEIQRKMSIGEGAQASMQVMQGLLRLRQIANHPKLVDDQIDFSSGKFEKFFSMITEAVANGHKVLVFSSFLKMLAMAKKSLRKAGINVIQLDGSTKDRGGMVKKFQEDPNVHVFLISLKAGGVGLTLTAADYVFIIDPWWNPQAENQAIDRAHRLGQKNNVFVYKMITKDTVEEKILAMQERKQALAEKIVVAEEHFVKHLTADDIDFLFA